MNDTPQISKTLLIINGILVVLVIGMIFLVTNILESPKATPVAPTAQAVTHAFDNIALQAKAVYVYDVAENKIVYQKNANVQLPLASLTKLMMANVASNYYPATSHVTVRKEFLQEDNDPRLAAGETWTMKDLLDFSLVVSSNNGARSIASVVGADMLNTSDFSVGRKEFIAKMNQTAQSLGLTQTYFVNEDGLDIGDVSGGYGSAQNVEKLLQYIIVQKPGLLEATKYPETTISSLSKNHTAVNTDTIIPNIPGLIASKTGYTSLAGGNLAVAFDASMERPMIIVVLGSSQDGRFTDVSQLVKASLAYVQEN